MSNLINQCTWSYHSNYDTTKKNRQLSFVFSLPSREESVRRFIEKNHT